MMRTMPLLKDVYLKKRLAMSGSDLQQYVDVGYHSWIIVLVWTENNLNVKGWTVLVYPEKPASSYLLEDPCFEINEPVDFEESCRIAKDIEIKIEKGLSLWQ